MANGCRFVQRFGPSTRHPLSILFIYQILAMNAQKTVDVGGRNGLESSGVHCTELASWLQGD